MQAYRPERQDEELFEPRREPELRAPPPEIFQATDIGGQAKWVLWLLWNRAGCRPNDADFTPAEIGEQLGLSPQAVRDLVKGLVAKGRLERVDQPQAGQRAISRVYVREIAIDGPRAVGGEKDRQRRLEFERSAVSSQQSEQSDAQKPSQESAREPINAQEALQYAKESARHAQKPTQESARSRGRDDAPETKEVAMGEAFKALVAERKRDLNAQKPTQVSARSTHDHDHDLKRIIQRDHSHDHQGQCAPSDAQKPTQESARAVSDQRSAISGISSEVIAQFEDPEGGAAAIARQAKSAEQVRRLIDERFPADSLGPSVKRKAVAAVVIGKLKLDRLLSMLADASGKAHPPGYFCVCLQNEFKRLGLPWNRQPKSNQPEERT